jgi:hypothetical protein
MKASTGKTVGLVFVIAIILAAGTRLTPLVIAPLGIFSGLSQAFRSTVHGLGRVSFEPMFGGALVIFWIIVLFWVYRDAERRGMNGVLWTLLVFIGNLVGLIIYLIVRNESRTAPGPAAPSAKSAASATSATTRSLSATESTGPAPNPAAPESSFPPSCPKCGKPADPKYAFCPYCGENLRPVCPSCGKPVEPAWLACAHCGKMLRG